MSRILNIVQKNIKLLLRSRSSALIVILGPLLIVFLVGLGFNTSAVSGLRLGVYSNAYSDLSNTLVSQLQKDFTVINTTSNNTCINEVKSGDIHVCAIFPDNLDTSTDQNIVFYVDYSRLNLVYNIIDTLSTQVQQQSTNLSTTYIQDILNKLNSAKVSLTNNQPSVTALSGSNSGASSKVDSDSSSLKGIDLSYTTLNVSDIEASINSAQSSCNTSLSSIITSLDGLQSSINGLQTKMGSADTTRTGIVNDLNNVKSTLDQNTNSLNTLSTSINSIVGDINSIKVTQAANIANPIKVRVEPVNAAGLNLNYLFPTLLIIIVMFVGIILASSMVIREKISNAYYRNFITPTSDFIFLIGNFLTSFTFVFIELIIILFLTLIFLGFGFFITMLNVFAALLFIVIVFVLIGMIVGYAFKSSETANLASISIASVLLFFSNTIFPIESLPGYFKAIVQFNPFVISETLLKRLILFNSNIITEWVSVALLGIFIIVLFWAAYLSRMITKRNL